jgi:hypothetical protein
MIKIDFDTTYEPIEAESNLSSMLFYSEDKIGNLIPLKIQILPLNDPLLPNVYNLSFGTLLSDKKIDDFVKINHLKIEKVFSTILLFCLVFLQSNSNASIGLDGSNDVRAYLYHRMFITNRDYFKDYFLSIGVDWYVKLLRNGEIELDKNGNAFFKPKPETFDYTRKSKDLYRYYMFHLIN